MFMIMMTAVLLSLLFPSSLREEYIMTYSNPVLVETYMMNRANPAPYSGTLGIGDPAVIHHGEKYYLYPTGDNHGYDVYISNDLVHWVKGPRIFQSSERGVWAPDIFYNRDDGMFYLYYTVNRRIGVAVADRPDGVFRDIGPLISMGIDAHMFHDDDGSYFLYYTRYPEFAIFVQPMSSPQQKKGEPVHLLSPTEEWEMNDIPVTEAPWIIKHQGFYYLLYSGGSADSENYAIGYATATNPLGPFTKYRGNPIVSKGKGIFGPGHATVIRDQEDKLWMVYHQQRDKTRGWNRIICIDPLWFDSDGILHGTASRSTPRYAPSTGRWNSGIQRYRYRENKE